MNSIALRAVTDDDLDTIFEQERDPEAVSMAAFTAPDPNDRAAFDAHMIRLWSSPDIAFFAIDRDGELVGSTASFVMDGRTEVTYWVDRAVWGTGVATAALRLLLDIVTIRPIYARAASDNLGSLAVLQKCGFVEIDRETSFAQARDAEIEETVLRLA
jgi:RimJ/RimL family protein N-acetyltransferase